MKYKKTLTSLALAAGLLVPSLGQACQWVRTGELNDKLECRSNYRNFFTDNSELFSKLLMEAAFYAQGSAEKLVIDNWAIRNALDVGEGADLLEKRRLADDLVNEINAQLRQLEALDVQGGKFGLPSAYMVGVTVPVNGDVSKMPFFKRFADFIPNPGGSAFIGWILIPQKVEMVLNEDKKLEGPQEYVTPKTTDERSYSNLLSSVLTQAPEESHLYDNGRIRLEWRFVVTPSLDAKTGGDGKYKNTYIKPTIGFAFGSNIVKSHQLLNNGPSASIPGSYIDAVRKISPATRMIPSWLLDPIRRRVDTVKVGYSWSGQDKHEKATDEDIVQFSENMFVWLRFGDRLKKTGLVGAEAAAVQKALEGKFRWGWFWNIGAIADGESSDNQNGLSGEMVSALASGIKDVAGAIITRSERIVGDSSTSIKGQIRMLEKSLAEQRGMDDDDEDKLSSEDIEAIQSAIEVLKGQLEDKNEAKLPKPPQAEEPEKAEPAEPVEPN